MDWPNFKIQLGIKIGWDKIKAASISFYGNKKQMHLSPMKLLLLLSVFSLVILSIIYFLPRPKNIEPIITNKPTLPNKKSALSPRLKQKSISTLSYLQQKGFSTRYIFLADMSMPSGKNRFFIYDIKKDSVIYAGLVAHGSCNRLYSTTPSFSNVPECGCSSLGKYKIGGAYAGRFGKAFKLHGLEATNSNAYNRFVVLHAYDCVPDREVYPLPICNSLGCPMVSYSFLAKATPIIEGSKKPILLWIF